MGRVRGSNTLFAGGGSGVLSAEQLMMNKTGSAIVESLVKPICTSDLPATEGAECTIVKDLQSLGVRA